MLTTTWQRSSDADPTGSVVACVANLSPVPRHDHRLGLPSAGRWVELVNTDAHHYGGSGMGNLGAVEAEPGEYQGQPASALVYTAPARRLVWLTPDGVLR